MNSGQGDSPGPAGMCSWAITCLLLSLVSAIFTFSGTTGEPGGLLGRLATVGFLVIALAMFFIRHLHLNNPR
jgi:uncharacterized membrane protein YtjA (UPF0391 family)